MGASASYIQEKDMSIKGIMRDGEREKGRKMTIRRRGRDGFSSSATAATSAFGRGHCP
jgi:hypothetical protein